jgi:hypothetical protein
LQPWQDLAAQTEILNHKRRVRIVRQW